LLEEEDLKEIIEEKSRTWREMANPNPVESHIGYKRGQQTSLAPRAAQKH